MLQYFLAIIEAKVTSDNDDDNDSVLFQVEINELLLNIVIGYIVWIKINWNWEHQQPNGMSGKHKQQQHNLLYTMLTE